MSKQASRFQKSTGWNATASGVPVNTGGGRFSDRADIGDGSKAMANGAAGAGSIAERERLLAAYRLEAARKQVTVIRCPFCGVPINARRIERHLRRSHPI
jgi:hypothetical protein